MSPGILTIVIFGCLILFLVLGIPVAFSLFGTALLIAIYLLGPKMLYTTYSASFHYMTMEVLVALPLFIFMASVLEFSGVVARLYDMAYKWFGPFRGGLAIGTLIIAAMIDAMSGTGATATVTLSVLALPEMLDRGYSRDLALGCIPAGGSLGPVIPPSVVMILLASLTGLSVGKLFAAGLFPGLMITGLWCTYVAIRSFLNPNLAPAIPPAERASWGQKFSSLRYVILPIFLIILVLGSIYGGVTTPTEAGGMGAVGALICAVINRQLNWRAIKRATHLTMMVTVLCLWLVMGGAAFAVVMQISGLSVFIRDVMLGFTSNPMIIVILQLLVGIFLGCFMDGSAILMITVPIFWPMVTAMPGIDPIWWGLVYTLTVCLGYITPPFGINLFYMIGAAPRKYHVTMGELYRAALPFSMIFLVGIVIVIVFPQIATWLPRAILK